MLIDLLHVAVIMRKGEGIDIKPVVGDIDGDTAGLFKAISEQSGPIVQPGGVDGYWFVGMVLFKQPEEVPVVVVRILYSIIIHIVLVRPDAGDQVVIPDSRNGWGFGVAASLSTEPGPGVGARLNDAVEIRCLYRLDNISRDPIHNDKESSLFRFCFRKCVRLLCRPAT